MNLYLVVSETLYEHIPITDEGEGPDEPYSLCELVLADSREQARWLVWQTDSSFDGDVRDMPNFRTRKLISGPNLGSLSNHCTRVVSDDSSFQSFWDHDKSVQLLNSLGSW